MKQQNQRYSTEKVPVKGQGQYTESYFDEDEPNPDDGLFLVAIGVWIVFLAVILCAVAFILLQAIF